MSRTESRIEMNESAFRSLVIIKIFLIWIEFKSRREYFNRQFKKKKKIPQEIKKFLWRRKDSPSSREIS